MDPGDSSDLGHWIPEIEVDGDSLSLTPTDNHNGSNSSSQQFYEATSSPNYHDSTDFTAEEVEVTTQGQSHDLQEEEEQCSPASTTNDSSEESESLVDMHLAKVADKLSKLIKSSESKRANIRTRLLKGELEPHFLALEHKVVAAEHIRTLEDLQEDVQKLRGIVAEDKERKDNEFKSRNEVFKEELFKEVVALLETEFSCVVCSEVFVQACVIDCGHTFCSYCINQWKKEKKECPICRTAIVVCTKHVEMDNFVTKIHTVLSVDIQNRRKDLVAERENTIRIAEEEEANRSVSGFNEFLVAREFNGFYDNVNVLLGHELPTLDVPDFQNNPNYPVTPPSSGVMPDRDMRMRQYRLMSDAAIRPARSSSPSRRHIRGPPMSSDEDDIDDDFEIVMPAPTVRALSPSEFPRPLGASASSNLPPASSIPPGAVIPPGVYNITPPSTSSTTSSVGSLGSMNNLRNHQPLQTHSRFCPFAYAHGMTGQNPPPSHHHYYTSVDWPSSFAHHPSHQFQYNRPVAEQSGGGEQQIGYPGVSGSFYSRIEPIAHPQAAHSNNRLSDDLRQRPLNQVPPPAHQNSSNSPSRPVVRQQSVFSQPQPTSSSSAALGATNTTMRPNVNVTFNVTSNVVGNPHVLNSYGFIPLNSSQYPQSRGDSVNNTNHVLPHVPYTNANALSLFQVNPGNRLYGWQPQPLLARREMGCANPVYAMEMPIRRPVSELQSQSVRNSYPHGINIMPPYRPPDSHPNTQPRPVTVNSGVNCERNNTNNHNTDENYPGNENNSVYRRLGRRRREESLTENEAENDNNENIESEPQAMNFVFDEENDVVEEEVEYIPQFPRRLEPWEGGRCDNNNDNPTANAPRYNSDEEEPRGMTARTVTFAEEDDNYDANHNVNEDTFPQPPRRRRRNNHRERAGSAEGIHHTLNNTQPGRRHNHHHRHRRGHYNPSEEPSEF